MKEAQANREQLVDTHALYDAIESMKNYAGYYTGNERSLNEVLAVEQWMCARFGEEPLFANLRARGPNSDPPDCEAEHKTDGLWGFEVTELVHEETRKQGQLPRQHDNFDPAPLAHEYSREEFTVVISKRLAVKKAPPAKWKGGPYAKRVLILTNDEELNPSIVAEWLREAVFAKPDGIDEAYLLLPPPPYTTGTPPVLVEGMALLLRVG